MYLFEKVGKVLFTPRYWYKVKARKFFEAIAVFNLETFRNRFLHKVFKFSYSIIFLLVRYLVCNKHTFNVCC